MSKSKKKLSLKALFKKSGNGNKNAKKEQLKTVAVLAGIALFGIGFYLYTDKPAVHKHKVTPHFAGAFGEDVGMEYDHERIKTLLSKIDSTNSKVDSLQKQRAAKQKVITDQQEVRTQKQMEALQKEIASLKAQVQKAAIHAVQTSAAGTDKKPPFEKVGPLKKKLPVNKVQPLVTQQPMINSIGIDDVSIQYPGLAKTDIRNSDNYVWAGSFANGYMLTGIIGDAGTNATKNKGTVAIKLTTNGTMPNGQTSHLKGCIVLGSTYGDLSSDSDVVHLETLSCAGHKYSFEKKVYGSVFDLDAMQDLRGIPVLKAKPILGYATVAGLVAGIGDGISGSGTSTSVTGSGVVQTPTSVFKSGLGEGISKPADKITDYLMAIANMYHPIVVAHAGRKVTVLFQAGFWIDKQHQKYESMRSIDSGHVQQTSTSTAQSQIQTGHHLLHQVHQDKLTQQVAAASGDIEKAAQSQAEGEFNQNKLKLGQTLFTPISKKD